MKKSTLNKTGTLFGMLAITSLPALADTPSTDKSSANSEVTVLPEVNVTEQAGGTAVDWKEKPAAVEKYKLPVTTESVTLEDMDTNINMVTVEDALKYEPSLLIRKRYSGDTNEPLQTRTATASQSARTMIYADGILLSTYLGNNNSNTGSPRWNTVSPNELERVDMLYGPFSAQYAGNSIGGVVNMTTKMPKKFETGANIQGAWGSYNIYGSKGDTSSENYTAYIGDKVNDLSFRFDFNHLDSAGQPITFATSTVGSGTNISGNAVQAAKGVNVNGAYMSANSYGVPMVVFGGSSINDTHQDNFKWKFAYDLTPTIQANYTFGMWQNKAYSGYSSYLTAPNGSTVTTGLVNIGNYQYNLSASGSPTFAPTLIDQTTWSHGASIKSSTGGKFDWELNASLIELGVDTSRVATVDPSVSGSGGAGRNTVLTGSNWNTADAKGIWRPENFYGKHEVSFGFHNDSYQLVNPVYNTSSWQTGGGNSIYSDSEGKTQTQGYWMQDAWDMTNQWNLTFGGRLENWNAYDGYNTSTVSGVLKTVQQTDHNAVNFSPKGKLTWNPSQTFRFGAAVGQAYRYPTAAELFQSSTIGAGATAQVLNGNPNLKPEQALSSEISGEYFMPNGKMRLSFFQEKVNNAIYSMSTQLSNGSVSSINSNVGQTDTYGLEFSGESKDVFIEKLNIYGSGTWADGKITNNAATDYAAALLGASASNPGQGWASTGAMLPRIPTYRSSFTISYSPLDKLTTSVSGRYSSATFSQLNNSDINHTTYIGNSAYFVVDTKVNYQITKQVSVNAGIDNINNEHYWIYHPFPQRTYMAQLKLNY